MPPRELNENTPIPIKYAWLWGTICVGGTLLAASIKADSVAMRRDLDAVTKEMVLRKEMSAWSYELALSNRDLKVPKFSSHQPEEKDTSYMTTAPTYAIPELSATR